MPYLHALLTRFQIGFRNVRRLGFVFACAEIGSDPLPKNSKGRASARGSINTSSIKNASVKGNDVFSGCQRIVIDRCSGVPHCRKVYT